MTTPPTTTTSALRPAAHFTTRNTWLNDPNGLLYHAGTYHLFFQTNPHGTTWGNISWGHATSTDLVTWIEQDVAIPYTSEEMAFSGSAVVDAHNTAGFAGPGETALVAVYTSARPGRAGEATSQSQSLAFSVDEGATWSRYAGNPVLDIGSDEFRDPKVFWYGGADGHWVMVAVEAVARRVVVYKSQDLITWTFASGFGPAHATDGVWECPDLFPLTVAGTDESRWVLVVSMNPGGIAGGSGTQYFVGDFDGASFVPDHVSDSIDPVEFDWLDYGRDYYAAVSFNNVPDDRRLMIGWASNWDYANDTPTHPWRSAMSLVREVSLVRCADGRLRVAQRPVLPEDRAGLHVFELSLPAGPHDHHALVLTGAGDDRLVITVDGEDRSITCDRTRSGDTAFHGDFPSVDWAPLPVGPDGAVDLLIVVDAMIVEIYAGDGLVTMTEQVFPSEPLTTLQVETRSA
ncbi:glycoside hydrolase family 32 protein [Microbacterium sp. SS28]|uniref:glycoside hydrolase family 32 protein n=1 Tax=Microbacterium sp. SS28 TaxID=2919948 RepID=UPI001FA9ED6E|nr:glycoside hydrolase family 32 protein [Microbacterium sp. SS28]